MFGPTGRSAGLLARLLAGSFVASTRLDSARVPRLSEDSAYSSQMASRSRAGIAALSTAVLASTLFASGWAFAAATPFRTDHREPLNNIHLTPGATFNVSSSVICVPGYAARFRDVSEADKLAVYAKYGVSSHPTGKYEIDHLIPLELGGSNAIANLWPELNDHPTGYLNSKDFLENRLHQLVCSGADALGALQRAIASNWVEAYDRYVGSWPSVAPIKNTVARPRSAGLTVTTLLSPIAPGSYELLKATTSKADDACSLAVTLPSGAASESNGLGPTTSTATGALVWTWLVGTHTAPGTAKAVVTCTAGSTSKSFVIS